MLGPLKVLVRLYQTLYREIIYRVRLRKFKKKDHFIYENDSSDRDKS